MCGGGEVQLSTCKAVTHKEGIKVNRPQSDMAAIGDVVPTMGTTCTTGGRSRGRRCTRRGVGGTRVWPYAGTGVSITRSRAGQGASTIHLYRGASVTACALLALHSQLPARHLYWPTG